eukprot:TRINITY_DN25768_c0_g1_i1.p1 TRINITY_DN25768_c0_g1~~TRINITY_DN25768_c0_g1_i1.p1  ORF type:complete len:479 (-),score=102.59 TRINITY_DN25768_c0_g1_i1:983-2386(-)
MTYDFATELFKTLYVPETVKVCAWVGVWVVLGFKQEYSAVDTTNEELIEVYKVESKFTSPLVAVEGRSVMAVCLGESVVVSDVRRGFSKMKVHKIVFEEVPKSICLCADYVIAVLKNHLQVKRWKPGKANDVKKKLRMFPHAQLLEIDDPKVVFEDSTRGHIFVTSSTNLFYLQPLNLMLKVRDLKWLAELQDKSKKKKMRSLVIDHMHEILLDRYHPFGHSLRIFTGNFKIVFSPKEKTSEDSVGNEEDNSVSQMYKVIRKYLREKKDMICKVWETFRNNDQLQDILEHCLQTELFENIYDLVLRRMTLAMASEIDLFEQQKLLHKDLDILDLKARETDDAETLEFLQDFSSPLIQLAKNLVDFRSPNFKFAAFADMHNHITDCFEKLVKIRLSRSKKAADPSKKFAITADEVLSLFIHICLQCPKELPVHLTFLFEFLPQTAFSGQAGFYLTSMQLAVQYISNLK